MRKLKFNLLDPLALILALIFISASLNAQSVDEALKNLSMERYSTATSIIKQVIQKDDKNAGNYYYAGYIYLNLDKPDSARYFFDQGVSKDPKEPMNYIGQGYLALNANKPQEALGLFDKAIELSKEKNPNVFNHVANALLNAETKDATKALSYLQKALALKKKDNGAQIDAQTHLLMGDAYLQLKDGGKAVSAYERAISLNQYVAEAHTKVGRIYLIPKNYEAALKEFEKAAQVDPNYAPVYKELGELYFSYKKDVAKARDIYKKYLDLSDVKTGSRSRYAAFLYVSRDYPNAIKEMRRVLQTEPNNIVMHRLLGYSLYETGKYDSAKISLDKYFSIVKPDKTLASDYKYKAKALMKLNQDSLAVENFYLAIQKDTADVQMIEDAAEELRKAKKFNESSKLYTELLSRKKDASANDYISAGIAHLYAKKYVKADSSFAKVIKLQPEHYAGYSYSALSKFYQDPESSQGLAKPFYEKVISILEADPELSTDKNKKSTLTTAYQYIASYYTKKEELNTAKSYWDKVEKIDPGNTYAKQFYEYLKDVEKYKAQQKKAQQSSSTK